MSAINGIVIQQAVPTISIQTPSSVGVHQTIPSVGIIPTSPNVIIANLPALPGPQGGPWLHNHQAGIDGEPVVTYNGDGSLSVAAGDAYFWSDSTRETIVNVIIPEALNLTPTKDITTYLCADRDTSSWVIRSDFDTLRYIPYIILFERTGSNSEHSQHILLKAHGEVESVYMRTFETNRYARAYGLDQVSVDNTLHVTSNSGRVYSVNHAYDLSGITSATRTFWCTQAGVYTSNVNPVIDNTQYDDGVSLQPLTTNYWVNIFLFRGVEEQDHCYLLRSNQFASAEEAKASNIIGTIPELISSHALLISRITVQQGSLVELANIQSTFVNTFNAASSVSDPNRNRKITFGAAEPSGGVDGDVYIQYIA